MAKIYGTIGGGSLVRCYLAHFHGETPFYIQQDQILGLMRDGGSHSEKLRIAISPQIMAALGLRDTSDFYTYTTNLSATWRMDRAGIWAFILKNPPAVAESA